MRWPGRLGEGHRRRGRKTPGIGPGHGRLRVRSVGRRLVGPDAYDQDDDGAEVDGRAQGSAPTGA